LITTSFAETQKKPADNSGLFVVRQRQLMSPPSPRDLLNFFFGIFLRA
jgi:hypothetical protein